MKVEVNKEILFEKLNINKTEHCEDGESFSEILEKEIEFSETKKTSVFMEIKRNKLKNDILDTLIDI
jgi:CRISPR/Cas system-associated protein Cas10 (large subunit of type III CRISPR-Cas system)